MTIQKRLVRSNIAMLLIPILTAAVLGALALCAMLILLRENLLTLHEAAEQVESVLHGFKLTLCLYGAAAALLILAVTALTNWYLTKALFSHISQPLCILMAGVARIRDGDLDTPIAYPEQDEFKAACDAVDEMAARLKASLEEQQTQQQKKQELIAGISHDLKSPLTSIRAYTEALLEGVAKDEESRQRYLQTIRAKEADIETMVNRLFAFAKMDMSQYPVHTAALPLQQTVQQLAEEWASEELQVEIRIPPTMQVLADRELLGHIFSNLFSNSRKYAGPKNICVHICASEANGMSKIIFSDNGAGVPPGQLARLFEPFYRADAARTAPGKGSGLGLAVVKKAVEAMNGKVNAKNGESGGLQICFTLPLAKEERHG